MTLRLVPRPQPLPDRLDLPGGCLHLWFQPWPPHTSGIPALTDFLERYSGPGAGTPAIRRGVNGKPGLDQDSTPVPPKLRFNLSHSHDRIALAFSRSVDPGVDIERIRHRPNALAMATQFFPPAEARWLSLLRETEMQWMFQRLWCAREAVTKALGEDLAFALNRVEFAADTAGEPVLVRVGDEDPQTLQLHHTIVPAQATGSAHDFQLALAWRGDAQEIGIYNLAFDDQSQRDAASGARSSSGSAPETNAVTSSPVTAQRLMPSMP